MQPGAGILLVFVVSVILNQECTASQAQEPKFCLQPALHV